MFPSQHLSHLLQLFCLFVLLVLCIATPLSHYNRGDMRAEAILYYRFVHSPEHSEETFKTYLLCEWKKQIPPTTYT